MVLFVRDANALARPAPEARLLRASEHTQLLEAHALVGAAQEEAARLAEAARVAYADERRRGYEEGREQARVEACAAALANVAEVATYMSTVETRIGELVLQGMQRLIDDFDDQERTLYAARSALAMVRDQKHVTLRVAPARAEALRASLDTVLARYPAITWIDVQADRHLTGDACVADTECGTVESSLDGQVEALRLALTRVLGTGQARADDARTAD